MTPLDRIPQSVTTANSKIPNPDPFFAFERCSVIFGGLTAVNDVTFTLRKGELAGLIGPNGAGKTTIFNLATGVYTPTLGRILFEGKQIAGPSAMVHEPAVVKESGSRIVPIADLDKDLRSGHTADRPAAESTQKMVSIGRRDVARAGICRTFQNIRLFGGLTVLENVLIASNWQIRQSIAMAMLRTPGYYRAETAARSQALDLLALMKLEAYAGAVSRSLPYGAQRRLEIARALATRPRLLLLDEPAAGMNPHESGELMEMIHWIRDQFSLTLLLIEHDMRVVMGMCERVMVLDDGALIADGTPAAIQRDPAVIAAYLGEEA